MGYFPGVGFAWKVNKDFFNDSSNVNDLKLRLGWGRTGNADIVGVAGFYPSSPYFSIGGSNSQYFPGWEPIVHLRLTRGLLGKQQIPGTEELISHSSNKKDYQEVLMFIRENHQSSCKSTIAIRTRFNK